MLIIANLLVLCFLPCENMVESLSMLSERSLDFVIYYQGPSYFKGFLVNLKGLNRKNIVNKKIGRMLCEITLNRMIEICTQMIQI